MAAVAKHDTQVYFYPVGAPADGKGAAAAVDAASAAASKHRSTRTNTSALRHYHDELFVKGGMCKRLKERTGHADGCKGATGFTMWTVQRSTTQVYDPKTGAAQPVHLSSMAEVNLPQWEGAATAPEADRANAARSDYFTALHEAGHRLTAEEVAAAITRFLSRLPARVKPAEAAAFNAAVNTFIDDFYIAAGRDTDVRYDAVTDHGYAQGAVYDKVPLREDAWWKPPPLAPVLASDPGA